MRRVAIVLAAGALVSCALVIGLDPVPYGDEPSDGATSDVVASDAGVDACPACGSHCCDPGAVCMNSMRCSNDAVAISAGGNHACALLADQSVWCWGENGVGQLGHDAGDPFCTFHYGSQTVDLPCAVAATKVDLPAARAIATGFQFTCAAVASDGAVLCWGENTGANLGLAYDSGPSCINETRRTDDGGARTRCSAAPVHVEGVTDAVEIAAGSAHACARTAGGRVFCWGAGGNGQIGNGDAGEYNPRALEVEGLPSDIVQITTGLYSAWTCAVSASGSAWCWGSNLPDEPQSFVAHRVRANGPLYDDAAEILTGINYVCLRHKSGSVTCSGYNPEDELGQLACDAGLSPPVTVVDIPVVKKIVGSWFHSCALDGEGRVHCWGTAQLGALGRDVKGELACDYGSSPPGIVPGIPPAVDIAAGNEITFAIDRDGKVWAWGDNDTARLGHQPGAHGDVLNCGDPGNQSVCNPVPVRVEGLP